MSRPEHPPSEEFHLLMDDHGHMKIVLHEPDGTVTAGLACHYQGLAQLAVRGRLFIAVTAYHGSGPPYMVGERVYELVPHETHHEDMGGNFIQKIVERLDPSKVDFGEGDV